jgi:hypothetical protein
MMLIRTFFYQGMYPTIIILLVALQKSHLECGFTYIDHECRNGALDSVHFAAPALYGASWSTESPERTDDAEGGFTVQEIQLAPEGSLAGSFGVCITKAK